MQHKLGLLLKKIKKKPTVAKSPFGLRELIAQSFVSMIPQLLITLKINKLLDN